MLAHYLHLAQETLGSNLNADMSQGTCTMKYNPRINEDLAADSRFANVHPWQDDDTLQGILEIYYEFEQIMKAVSGMDRFTLQPGGGAHAVFTAASMIRAYHRDRGEAEQRNEVITTMFSHPCDAASPATAGFKIVTLMPKEDGYPDLEALKAVVGPHTAAIHITNPEDTGIYNPLIEEFVKVVHEAGGVCFNDQANGNVLMGIARTRDAGFDFCHYNLHKTFAVPHGGSGPGTGAMGCREEFAKYLPYPTVEKDAGTGRYYLDYDRPDSIGKIKGFLGSAGVVLRSYAWAVMMGPKGLRETAEISALNNNYFMELVEKIPGITAPYAEGHRRLEECRWSWQELTEETGRRHRRHPAPGRRLRAPALLVEPPPVGGPRADDDRAVRDVLQGGHRGVRRRARADRRGGAHRPGDGQAVSAQVRRAQALRRRGARRPHQVGHHLAGLQAEARHGVTLARAAGITQSAPRARRTGAGGAARATPGGTTWR